MLEIFNNLKPFFEDNYRRISVREYARIKNVSPPSASKILKNLKKEGILLSIEDKRYLYFYAHREDIQFVGLQRTYYAYYLKELGLMDYIEKELVNPVVIIFGSLAKAELKQSSDIDLALFSVSEKELDLTIFEKKLKRTIQVFRFNNPREIKNKMLLNNILNGMILLGGW